MKLAISCLLYIWAYMLNACILPPSDSSGRSRMSAQTFGDEIYRNIKQQFNIPDDISVLKFKLKACADGFLALSTYPSIDDGPYYLIILGGWGNSKSIITRKSPPYPNTKYKGVVVNCHVYKPFWVQWINGNIKVGQGSVPLQDVIMHLEDENLNFSQPFRYIGITSAWGNRVQWTFDLTYKNDTVTEDKYCSETSKENDNSLCLPVNPCHNNGKCLSNKTTYNCYCDEISEKYGAHCEKHFIICQENPCQNGGTCLNRPNGHNACLCQPPYKGYTCEIVKQNKPHWKEAFINHHNWSGIYYHANQRVPFSLSVHKLVYGPEHMMLATFKDNETILEMRGFSLDDIYVTFELSSIIEAGSRLNLNSGLKLSGLLASNHHSGGWEYKGKITLPENDKFGAFQLHSKVDDKKFVTVYKSSTTTTVPIQQLPQKQTQKQSGTDAFDLKVGLGIGFGILIATVVAIGLIFYLRKGCRRKPPASENVVFDYNRINEPH